MFILLRIQLLRAMVRFAQEVPLWKVALLVVFHCVTSWLLVTLFEPGAEFARFDTYWYFYLVTATTVGYGDFSPSTLGSRLVVTLYVMPIGIAILGVVIGKVASLIAEIGEKVRTGTMQHHLQGHTIVVGDNSPRTGTLLKNIMGDDAVGKVLLVHDKDVNPFKHKAVAFVSGHIESAEVRDRACFKHAARIIILADNDSTVIGRTLVALNHNLQATVIVFFHDDLVAENLRQQIDKRVRIVTSTDMDVLAQEALDPGAAVFVRQLMQNGQGETYMTLPVPASVSASFTDIVTLLIRQRVNVLGVYEGDVPEMCPDPDMIIDGNSLLAVAVNSRSELSGINWSPLCRSTAC